MTNHEMILFGCWNEGLCNTTTHAVSHNGMSAVMKKLEYNTRKSPPDFIVVLGDNYYPKKKQIGEIKKKIFNKNELKSGFDCLKELETNPIDDKPGINLLMGNHDLQEENGIVSNDDSNQNECIITETEMKMINDDKIDTESYGRLLGEHTICLFICSTLYTEKADEIVKCMGIYRQDYSEERNKAKQIDDYFNEQIQLHEDDEEKVKEVRKIKLEELVKGIQTKEEEKEFSFSWSTFNFHDFLVMS